MPKIIKLDIKNFRGIETFTTGFNKEFTCLIGRGDSGKTTILDAIAFVLSPSWSLRFYDSDFYNFNTNKAIEITVSLIDIPENLSIDSKYGLLLRGFNTKTNTIQDEIEDGLEPVLTIQLQVDQSLEPVWYVINKRSNENREIKAADRSKLNCFLVSDYIDRHFSWTKGGPLYSLLSNLDTSETPESNNIIVNAIRTAKDTIDQNGFPQLEKTVEYIIKMASTLGLNISDAKSTIDFKDINLKEGRLTLHDGNIPFRQMGKGSKRLSSIAIQLAMANRGGIILIDEIEQGLEPDRIRQLARSLRENELGQIIITTHSRDAITELESKDLMVIHKSKENSNVKTSSIALTKEELQGVVRACPEAFFAKKIIVCEGATEVGICRALDSYREQKGSELMAFLDCAYIDGGGDTFPKRASEIKKAKFDSVAVLCDSDVDDKLKPSKEQLVSEEIKIFDFDENNSIENQVFLDLPWAGIKDLLEYVVKAHDIKVSSLCDSINSRLESDYKIVQEKWLDNESTILRTAIGIAANKCGWLKRIDHAMVLGEIIFKHFDDMAPNCTLRKTLSGLSNWIDK